VPSNSSQTAEQHPSSTRFRPTSSCLSSWVDSETSIIMKSWGHLDDAHITRRRAPAREIGFLTAVFVALIVIAGLDTIFPGVTHKLTSHLSANQGNTGFRHAEEPFEWSQVRIVRSPDTQACDPAASYQMER
jgi:hypothetical protein